MHVCVFGMCGVHLRVWFGCEFGVRLRVVCLRVVFACVRVYLSVCVFVCVCELWMSTKTHSKRMLSTSKYLRKGGVNAGHQVSQRQSKLGCFCFQALHHLLRLFSLLLLLTSFHCCLVAWSRFPFLANAKSHNKPQQTTTNKNQKMMAVHAAGLVLAMVMMMMLVLETVPSCHASQKPNVSTVSCPFNCTAPYTLLLLLFYFLCFFGGSMLLLITPSLCPTWPSTTDPFHDG